MRLLADENIPLDLIEALSAAGHSVAWIRTDSPGVDDEGVLQTAVTEARLLITFDKDFGELAFRRRLPSSSGVILCRMSARSSAEMAAKVVDALATRDDWAGHFSVIDDNKIRMRPLSSRQ